MSVQLIRIGYNHDTGRKFGKLIVVLKKISARFRLQNWSAPARLGSAQNLHSSGSLEPKNSSSNSSLQYKCDKIDSDSENWAPLLLLHFKKWKIYLLIELDFVFNFHLLSNNSKRKIIFWKYLLFYYRMISVNCLT